MTESQRCAWCGSEGCESTHMIRPDPRHVGNRDFDEAQRRQRSRLGMWEDQRHYRDFAHEVEADRLEELAESIRVSQAALDVRQESIFRQIEGISKLLSKIIERQEQRADWAGDPPGGRTRG